MMEFTPLHMDIIFLLNKDNTVYSACYFFIGVKDYGKGGGGAGEFP